MVPITLEQFLWSLRAPRWQRDDYREHCLDNGTAYLPSPRAAWLADFQNFVADDSALFDADGGGLFVATPVD